MDGFIDDTVAFARGNTADLSTMYGKFDDDIRLRLPFELRQKVVRLAHDLGMNESDFIRQLLMIRVEGVDHMRSVAEARMLAVAGPCLGGGTNSPQGVCL